ncbi:carboxylesterase/lipase family protein [Rhizobium rhizogenes]|uniref:carboxylesterase/lipase family protein n=1 Tax=Rhizobium rhizogenes TaxID=359 RepID=UPI00157179B7|nr:carboxylesterase family protein [Rhizobium rhizogenes]NTF83956.1 carboxylesterase family protein [Rhizobium rhizogenes]
MKQSILTLSLAVAVAYFLGIASQLAFAADGKQASDLPVSIVKVEGGFVKGVPSDAVGVQIFKGIPFAGPTGGSGRFKAPSPVVPWSGVKVTDTWGDQGLQDNIEPGEPPVSENGLNLIVYTPARSVSDRLPVYMQVYGGANRGGRASQPDINASRLAAKGIVVVSVQYRMGPMGFLALPEMAKENVKGAAGNYGVLDLVKGLHWIHDYVEGFGGNPDLITIGGQSSGAENVTALLRSPLAKGLFKRAFLSSNFTGFLPGKYIPIEQKAAQNQRELDRIFGKPTTLADLRALSASTFLSSWRDGRETLYTTLHDATVRAQFYTVDGYVFTKDSIDLMRPHALDGLDVMMGGTADEYTFLRGGENKTLTPDAFDKAMRNPHGYGKFGIFDDDYKRYYRPDTDLDAYRLYLRSLSDRQFAGYRISGEYAKAHNDNFNIYTFYWDHVPPGRDQGFYGAYHSADLPYFNASLRDTPEQRKWTDPDYRMADLASSYLANFIKTGNPNADELPYWGQTTTESRGQFMRFSDGYGYLVANTPYPSRDAYNRKLILQANGLSEAAIAH